jgi:hypothetical protein
VQPSSLTANIAILTAAYIINSKIANKTREDDARQYKPTVTDRTTDTGTGRHERRMLMHSIIQRLLIKERRRRRRQSQ